MGFTDGISHVLFLVVLAAMMYLWAPSSGSQRLAYSAQVDTKDPENDDGKPVVAVAADAWMDEGLDEDDSFWTTARPATSPSELPVETIGAASLASDEIQNAMGDDFVPVQKTT